MKLPILVTTFAVVLTLSIISLGQANPRWIDILESDIQKKQPNWRMDQVKKKCDSGVCQLYFKVQNENERASIDVLWLGFSDVKNASDTLHGHITVYGSGMGPNTIRQEIRDYGDEGTFFSNRETKDWSRLLFRRQRAIVEIHSRSESLTRKLAEMIDKAVSEKAISP